MRPRHYVPRWLVVLLAPLFRYSVSRDAYILRGVGQRRGPVLKAGKPPEPITPRPPSPRFVRSDDAAAPAPGREHTGHEAA